MATDFVTLQPKVKGEVLKIMIQSVINNPNAYLGDNGDNGINFNLRDGTSITIQNRPGRDQITAFIKEIRGRNIMNPLFRDRLIISDERLGLLTTNRALTTFDIEKNYTVAGEDETYRKLGYEIEEVKNNIEQLAVTKPSEFLRLKNVDIININKRAYNTYKEAYDKFRQFGYDDNTSFEKAKVAANSFKNELMKVHEKEYPSTLEKDAKSRINQNVP